MVGLYTTPREDSFVSADVIKRDIEARDALPPIFHTPTKTIGKDFGYWSERMKDRQAVYQETANPPKVVDIEFFDETLITLQADHHIGGAYTDYARIEAEAKLICETPNSFVFLVGDLMDAFFFNPAQFEDIEAVPEQIEYARALVKYYADNGKLLGAWNGNHDAWIKKHGFDPYTYILEGIDTHYFHGVGYVRAKVCDEIYRLVGNHMFKGSSIYSNTHPQRRAVNESARDSDVVFSGHWHTKGISQQSFQSFGGDSQITTMIALGTYKATDEYIRTYGFSNRDPNSMYGASIRLSKKDHTVMPYYDILKAHEEFK